MNEQGFYILDTETTGITSSDQVIELAYFRVGPDAKKHREFVDDPHLNLKSIDEFAEEYEDDPETFGNFMFYPSVPIHPKAKEVHGIDWKDLKGKPFSSKLKLPENLYCMIGHNVNFDWRMLGKPDCFQICTMQIAKKAWPKSKHPTLINYSLDGLIQFLYPEESKTLLRTGFHRAFYDARLTALVLLKILEYYKKIEDIEQLITLTKQGN